MRLFRKRKPILVIYMKDNPKEEIRDECFNDYNKKFKNDYDVVVLWDCDVNEVKIVKHLQNAK